MNKLGKNILLLLFSIYSVSTFLCAWTIYAFSGFSIHPFDGALRYLAHYYIKAGFIPYKEFLSHYPPGLFILIGKIIPFTSLEERNLIIALLVIFLLLASLFLLIKLADKAKQGLFVASLFLFLNIPTLDEISWSEPISRLLIVILILFLVLFLKKGRRYYLFLACLISGVVIFFRWNNLAVLLVVELIILVVLAGFDFLKEHSLALITKRWVKFLLFQSSGALLGFLILIVYLLQINALKEGVEFIFIITTQAVSQYRSLPLPKFKSVFDINALIYVSGLVFLLHLLYLKFSSSAKKVHFDKKILIAVAILPIFTLPYVITRADVFHTSYLFYFTGLSVLINYLLLKQGKLIWLLILLFLPVYSYLIPVKPISYKDKTLLSQELLSQLNDCKKKAEGFRYQSIFVGKKSYNRYINNFAAMYLINTNIKPATRFIADDPGIQNSLKYGRLIADDLKIASKPMLVYMDLFQRSELNNTRFMTSAGRIEQFLAQNSYQDLGMCTAFGTNFLVRIYR